jgi:AcrR family transcriptional regulator
MGIEDRKEREKERLKEQILDAAFDLFRQGGYEAVTVRKIAELIEYSPTTIYLYFKNKDAVLFALCERGFQTLLEYMSPAMQNDDLYERLRMLGQGYLKFGLEHPQYYDLMFIAKDPMRTVTETHGTWEEFVKGKRTFENLLETVQQLAESGYFKADDVHPITLNLWSYVHGIVSLIIRDRLIMFQNDEMHHLLEYSLNHLLNHYITKPT